MRVYKGDAEMVDIMPCLERFITKTMTFKPSSSAGNIHGIPQIVASGDEATLIGKFLPPGQ